MNTTEETSRGGIRRIARMMLPYRIQMVILVGLTVIMALIATLPPLVTRALIDQVFTRGNTSNFFILGLLMVLVYTCYLLIYQVQSSLCSWLGQRFVFDLRTKLYRHLLGLSLRFFSKYSTGKLVNRLMGDSGTVQSIMTAQTMTVISDLIIATCATLATFIINWRLALVLMMILVIFVLNYRINIRHIITATKSLRSSYDRLSGGVQNRLVATMAVKTFGGEGRENRAFAMQSEDTIRYGKEQGIAGNTFWSNVGLINALGNSVLYFLGCAMVINGDMTFGDVLAFTAYSSQLLWPAVRFSNLANQLQQVALSTERLLELFDEEPEIKDSENSRPFARVRGEIEFRDVCFHYTPGIEIIKGFSLHVNPGDTIALIGPTGCGKSTILNLIIRYYDVTGGTLLMDGKDIRELNLHSLRKQFGIVLQESHLFATTIRENIRYSRPDATDEMVEAAARTAEIHDFIMGLEKGYETRVGDFGVELSVGQKQRINIARAICADPAILIMDEATSSLDSNSEQAIQRAMDKVLQGRTSFIVAHRLSTIRNATKIVLLDKGCIQESGTHDELMQIPDGRYRELYLKHMGQGVIEEEE